MRKHCFFLALIIISASSGFSQSNIFDHFKDWKPRNIGPASMAGRITAIDAVVDDPNTIYLGAASGGVWKTTNGGASWNAVFDDQPTLNIGSVAVQQNNPNIVWVGTGEGNPRNSISLGGGIYKSMDAGKTWKLMGLEKTITLHRIRIDPTNPDVLYAAATGNPFAPHPEKGVWKTTDGGATWKQILHTNDSTGCGELIMDPSNPNKLIANMWQFYRTPYSSYSGGDGSGLYITIDGGKNWKKLGAEDGLPKGDLGRCGLAFAPSRPSRVYALVEATKNGLYQSDDGGFSWELINSKPQDVVQRPFYFQDIAVDPSNENRIYHIYSMVSVSEDGGKNFKTLLPYGIIHPDHHAWWISPKDANFIIDGNDGGIGISHDRGDTWKFDETLAVGQFYHIAVDNMMPYNVMGGMQDNGSWHGPAYTFTDAGIRNYYWENIGGGDGFDVMPDADNPEWVYSESQQGYVNRYNWKTGEQIYIRPFLADTSLKLRFNWNAAMAQDPFDNSTIYFGSQFLHKSTDKGINWDTISSDLTTNNKEQQRQDDNGGLTLDITGAENYNTILAIAPSPVEKGVIWVGTDDGNLQLTRDGGKSWTNFRGKIKGMPVGAWIPQVRASNYNAGEAFVVANDYRRGDFGTYVFRTTDYGKTWTRMVDEKKVNGYALCIIQDPVQPNLIFLGTEHGLWISLDNGNTYTQWKNGYPSVSTYDLAIQEREADLAIATFGRSLWILDDIRPLRSLAASKGSLFTKNITAFPIGDAYQIQYKSAPGYDWSTAGIYDAENRKRGVPVSFYLNPVGKEKAKKPMTKPAATTESEEEAESRRGFGRRGGSMGEGSDTVNVKIYDAQGKEIRNLKWLADSGYNRMYWGMEEKGYRQPGMPEPKPDAPEPGGFRVLPGTYTVVLNYAGDSSSSTVSIKPDPRVEDNTAARKAQYAALEKLQKTSDQLTETMDWLSNAEDVAKKMNAYLKDIKGAPADSLRKSTDAVQKELTRIREEITGKPDRRQGITRNSDMNVLTVIRMARQYIMGQPVAPGKADESLMNLAQQQVTSIVDHTKTFMNGKWKDYQQQVQQAKIDPFSELKSL